MTRSTSSRPARNARDGGGVRGVALDPEMERPQAAQDEEAVERPGHAAHRVLEEPQPLGDRVVARDGDAEDRVRVAGEVLRRRVEDDVGAERERVLEGRRGERVVDDDERPAPPALGRPLADRSRPTAAMSMILRYGFVGDSNQTSRVRSVSSSQSASGPECEVGVAGVDAAAAGGPARSSGTCRRRRRRRRRSRRRRPPAGRSPRSPPSRSRTRSRGAPPSSAATARSSRSRVGFWDRAYS